MARTYEAFTLDDLEQKAAAASGPYWEFLRRRGMSLGIYTLSAGGDDLQHPHSADEVYVVLGGSGKLQVAGGDDISVSKGSVISVDHGEEHKFKDITEELRVLVIFAPPESPDKD